MTSTPETAIERRRRLDRQRKRRKREANPRCKPAPPLATGSRHPGHNGRAFTVFFDDATIDKLRTIAARKAISFGEQIRTFVEWGLDNGY